ncbi:FeoA family protein [Scopulibacillus cellulosilyticus]|uniref:Ferrous iron transport protein A n=1 Tax=Scopulibacillus cellulosilyticus TaxID=2665665 RepID=A0ABW2Q0F7_9BACL
MELTQMKPGEKGFITDISKINPLIQNRLLDLGIKEGEKVCYKYALPFGGPCMLEACGQCIGIRRKEAKCIRVEKV